MAKPKHNRKCQHLVPRSPRHPIADLACGSPAKAVVKYGIPLGCVSSEPDKTDMDVCGRHANYWAVRNYNNKFTVEPIEPKKDSKQ